MKSLKTFILYVFAIIFLIGILILFSGIFSEEKYSDLTKKPLDNSFQG
jgi:NADH:ubiquinone oxidoreductase subunit H